jgi:hypothetical protein
MFLIGAVAVFRIIQLTTAKTDTEIAYPSLKHFRAANSQRYTFRTALKCMAMAWRDQQNQDEEEANEEENIRPHPNILLSQATRATRSNANLQPTLWGNPKIGFTPVKNVKSFYSKASFNQVELEIKDRRTNCMGLPLYRVFKDPVSGEVRQKGKGSRGKCARCSGTTQMWCGICHTWLCGPHVEMKNDEDESSKYIFKLLAGEAGLFRSSSRLSDDSGIVCRNSCWHEWHNQGYKRISDKAW